MFKKIIIKINDSLRDASGKVSHTKISSYIILIGIMLTSLVYTGIELFNAIMIIRKGDIYEIPTANIAVLGLFLAHHLALLGIKKNSEK